MPKVAIKIRAYGTTKRVTQHHARQLVSLGLASYATPTTVESLAPEIPQVDAAEAPTAKARKPPRKKREYKRRDMNAEL